MSAAGAPPASDRHIPGHIPGHIPDRHAVPDSIRVTTLPSGLRVASDAMPAVDSVSVGAWVDVGARTEAAEVNGITHLVEHMLFKGTRRRSAQAIAEQIEDVGGQINAYTSREQTAYFCKVLQEDLGLAVDILADILQHSIFDPTELAREQAVVLQEIGQAHDTPDDIVFDHFQATAFPGQPVGRPVLGTPATVEALSRDRLLGHVGHHYTAPRMVIAAAGRLDHDRLVELAATTFADLPAGAPLTQDTARYVGGDYREDRDLEQVHYVLGFEGVGYRSDDFYTHSVLSMLLGGGMSSRLFQEIRERRGLVYSLYSFSSAFCDVGLFGIYAGTGEDGIAELVPVLCDELLKAADTVSDDEVDRARAQMRAGVRMAQESTGSRCEQLAQQLQVYGRPQPPAEVLDRLDAVTRRGVQAACADLLASPPTMAAVGPLGRLPPLTVVSDRLAGRA